MPPAIKQAPISCPGHTRPVVDIYFSSQTDCGNLFITAAKDSKAILRRGDTGDWIGSFIGHQGAVWACVLDAHATKAATGSADFTAKLWDTSSGQVLLSLTEDHIVRSIDLSKTDSGAHLLTANNSKRISVYDLMIPDKPLICMNAHGQFIRRVAWCDGDRRVLTASEDGTLKLWDLNDRKNEPVLSAPLDSRLFPHSIVDFQFRNPLSDQSGGSVTLAVACGSSVSILTVDWRNRPSCLNLDELCTNLPMPHAVNSVTLHPTEDVLACGGEDHYVYRMDRFTGQILDTCKGHFGPIHCVRFSPDGQVFASGSEDGTVRLWQTVVGQEFGLWRLSVPPSNLGKIEPAKNGVQHSTALPDPEPDAAVFSQEST